ncbi:hypothetical protein TRFO_18128 [Tritrichomonas foetus]|uniref:Uncharacterized protein n=1 Tax=Tritrichomonas foetus TaxID=1144522 RepID=A0A1J4KLN1_9EUKA|nr:hypothetical protein TRFO_18128 [Tritrichomonas foetus]|eukprot:OHT12215.1 hypothetical protein TRFO_18128 [Tritrichomonas foetus]
MSKYPARVDAVSISDRELDLLILECYPVRRPLLIPSTKNKIGEVLSHSGIMCVTAQGSYLIEFMCDNIVYVKAVKGYHPGEDFDFDDFHFIHDDHTGQNPSRPVTLRRIAVSMAYYMEGKKFDTFTHNCHLARYLAMKKYGMTSRNPKKAKRNIFFQGFFDFFSGNKKKKEENKEIRTNISNSDVNDQNLIGNEKSNPKIIDAKGIEQNNVVLCDNKND